MAGSNSFHEGTRFTQKSIVESRKEIRLTTRCGTASFFPHERQFGETSSARQGTSCAGHRHGSFIPFIRCSGNMKGGEHSAFEFDCRRCGVDIVARFQPRIHDAGPLGGCTQRMPAALKCQASITALWGFSGCAAEAPRRSARSYGLSGDAVQGIPGTVRGRSRARQKETRRPDRRA